MSDPLTQVGISWKNHQQSDRQSSLDSTKNQGKRHYLVSRENIKFMETEKSYSVLSFNWKEENLLKKKLSFLDSMKKHEANARLMEQKIFYKRCHSKLRRAELAHARLLGNKDLVRGLTSRNALSSYTATLADDSEAAVKAIVQNRREWENKMLFSLSLDKHRPHPPTASRSTLKADSRDEGWRATVGRRGSPSRGEGRSVLVLSLESPDNPEQGGKQRRLPVASRVPLWGEGVPRESPSRPRGPAQSQLQTPDIGGKSEGKLLKYIVYGDRSEEHPKKKRPRPRKNSRGPGGVKTDPALPTQVPASLKQEFLASERAKYLDDRNQSLSQPTHFSFQDYSFLQPLAERHGGGTARSRNQNAWSRKRAESRS